MYEIIAHREVRSKKTAVATEVKNTAKYSGRADTLKENKNSGMKGSRAYGTLIYFQSNTPIQRDGIRLHVV